MKHPEDEIYRVKQFIKELSNVQDRYFQELVNTLGLTSEGEEWLFDHIFNGSNQETFEEYLENYGKTFGELK
jgi:hypothetical protein